MVSHSGKQPSTRQLKVGEMLRHSLSSILLEGHFHELTVPVTVTEVRVSPDLRNATVFIHPLGGQEIAKITKQLTELAPQIRKQVAKRVHLRYAPKLHFKEDTSFMEVAKIEALLQENKSEDE